MTEAALSAAPPNSVALQLREKDLGARELLELARQLRIVCDRYGARLLVNDRLDVAIAAGADGVHLPSNSFALADARALVGPDRLIGVSTHEHGEVVTASTGGADYNGSGRVTYGFNGTFVYGWTNYDDNGDFGNSISFHRYHQ